MPRAGYRRGRPRTLGVVALELPRARRQPRAEIGLEAGDVGAEPYELVVEQALLVADVVVGLPARDAGTAVGAGDVLGLGEDEHRKINEEGGTPKHRVTCPKCAHEMDVDMVTGAVLTEDGGSGQSGPG